MAPCMHRQRSVPPAEQSAPALAAPPPHHHHSRSTSSLNIWQIEVAPWVLKVITGPCPLPVQPRSPGTVTQRHGSCAAGGGRHRCVSRG